MEAAYKLEAVGAGMVNQSSERVRVLRKAKSSG